MQCVCRTKLHNTDIQDHINEYADILSVMTLEQAVSIGSLRLVQRMVHNLQCNTDPYLFAHWVWKSINIAIQPNQMKIFEFLNTLHRCESTEILSVVIQHGNVEIVQ